MFIIYLCFLSLLVFTCINSNWAGPPNRGNNSSYLYKNLSTASSYFSQDLRHRLLTNTSDYSWSVDFCYFPQPSGVFRCLPDYSPKFHSDQSFSVKDSAIPEASSRVISNPVEAGVSLSQFQAIVADSVMWFCCASLDIAADCCGSTAGQLISLNVFYYNI